MRRIIRTILRTGHDSDVWPVVLLLIAVLVPAVCLLWFMGAAMRNERLAARQKLADAYHVQLAASQARLQQHWKETAAELEKLAATAPAPLAFAECVRSGLVNAVVIFDDLGRISYPDAPLAAGSDFGALEAKWNEAGRLENLRKFLEAAKRYAELAQTATNANFAARAIQSEARCRMRAGQIDAVIWLIDETFNGDRFRHATDPQGRLIVANAELMALELITNRSLPAFQSIARRLAARLADYENPALAAPQRRFLMKEVQRLSPETIEFPTLAAEQLAAEVIEEYPPVASEFSRNRMQRTAGRSSLSPQRGEGRGEGWEATASVASSAVSSSAHPSPSIPLPVEGRGQFALQRSASPGVWQFTTPNQRALALIQSDKLLANTKSAAAPDRSLTDVKVTLVPPDVDAADAFVTLPAGEQMPGWRLALSFNDGRFFEATAGRQTAVYLWTGILVVAAMGVLALLAVRLVRRQMTLARLKNDLTATVSHELKTPLSSMRVLVDTLLDSERLDETKTREYLRLIAGENERLGRLIQNFLTFSRMEKKKYALHFSLLRPHDIVEAAIQSAHGRFDAPGCRLEVQVEDNLPPIMMDPDALVAALINLLENACKYSEEIKHIVLGARAENGRVIFSVKDNGIGITPRDQRRIFQPFHQVDQRLSRKGSGCGLGLSIVQFITAAHHGSVSVESQLGRGSVFAISIPVASDATTVTREAIA